MPSIQEPPIQTKDERFPATQSLPGRDRRVHIIGAGPVGLFLTALLQPIDGLSVRLYEKRHEYTRSRMVQLSSYLVADSVESYSADHIDGDTVFAVFDPPELNEGLAFRQAIPSDLMTLLQQWSLGFCPLHFMDFIYRVSPERAANYIFKQMQSLLPK